MATREAIENLKASWVKDPCWDIEETEGFEEHKDELLAYRLEKEKQWVERVEAQLVAKSEALGVSKELASALHTFQEIEINVGRLDWHIGNLEDAGDRGVVLGLQLQQEQVRATLLLTAQVMKAAQQIERIADQIEATDNSNFMTELYKDG